MAESVKERSAQMAAAADYWIHEEVPLKFGELAKRFGLNHQAISIACREDNWKGQRAKVQARRNSLAVSVTWNRETLAQIEAERRDLAEKAPFLQSERQEIADLMAKEPKNSPAYKRLLANFEQLTKLIAHASGKDLYDATLRKKLADSPKGLVDDAGQSAYNFSEITAIDLDTRQVVDLDGEPIADPTHKEEKPADPDDQDDDQDDDDEPIIIP